MQVSVKLRNLRIAPRKVRLVADSLRGKKCEEAQAILNFTIKKAALPILKLLNSALANAKNDFQFDPNNLYISRITVDEGQKLKRWRARARGSANEILKRTSQVNLVLEEIVKSKLKKIKKTVPLTPGVDGETPGVEAASQKQEKPKLKSEVKTHMPKIKKGVQRIFRRKAF